jgi:1,4-dihydroxy-2-naphthoate polyprenyltransferase
MIFQQVRLFIRLSRPIFLGGAVLTYALGVGIVRYLGFPVDWGLYFLGQAWVTSIQLSAYYLIEYFDSPHYVNNPNPTVFSTRSGSIGPGKLTRNTALMAAATTLTIGASLTVIIIQFIPVSPLIVFLMFLIFLIAISYSVPPIELASSGYGELTNSILIANLVPALALTLQMGEFHRLLIMSTFPLTALHIAMMIAMDFPDYATHIKHEKRTMLVRLGWQNGMVFHNLLILTAFLLLGVAMLFGLHPGIGLPAFLPLPLGLLLIWLMRRVAAGAAPNWRGITLAAVILFASTTYLLAFSFWTR